MTATHEAAEQAQTGLTGTIGGIAGAPAAARAAELTARAAAGTGDQVEVLAPFTGKPITSLPQIGDADVRAAFERARVAQRAWAARPATERQKIVYRMHDMVLAAQDEALDLIQVETGKARLHAFDEIASTAITAAYYGKRSAKLLAPHRRAGIMPVLTKARQVQHPKGVVTVISPWNYPLALTAMDVLPALVAGNAVVQKPDNQTALSALWLQELAGKAGLPADLWQVVLGRGSVIGTALLDEADYVAFTGSTATGRTLAAQVAAHLTGYSMELGGKNPMLVLADANVDKAATGAVGACFSSAGQLCVSVERIYVHESIRDSFTRAFVARTEAMKLGTALDYSTDMGSLTTPGQLDTIAGHVQDARAHGATVLTGGQPRPAAGPLFYEPTVLTDVTEDMLLCREETFGPVVAIYGFTDVDEAVTRANDTEYGLNASVWTRDRRAGEQVAARIHAGTVNVNEGYAATLGSVAITMGGMGASGVGRRNGAEGLLKYTEQQSIASQRGLPLRPLKGMPSAVWTKLMSTSLRLLKSLPRG